MRVLPDDKMGRQEWNGLLSAGLDVDLARCPTAQFSAASARVTSTCAFPGLPIGLLAQARHPAFVGALRLGAENNPRGWPSWIAGQLGFIHPGADPQHVRGYQEKDRTADGDHVARIVLPA